MLPHTSSLHHSPHLSGRLVVRIYGGRQKGAVLVVGLVILLLLTLIGVQVSRTNVAQQRMAANWQDRHVAFEAAEAVLRFGERQGPFDPFGAPDELAEAASWDGVTDQTGSLPGFHHGLAVAPSYHVGPARLVRIGIELPAQWRRLHTVTSRGAGMQPSSLVIMQSVYEPPD